MNFFLSIEEDNGDQNEYLENQKRWRKTFLNEKVIEDMKIYDLSRSKFSFGTIYGLSNL